MTFIARFSGTPCDSCEERISEGDEVQYNAANRLVHVLCPEARDVDEIPTTCPSCFMSLPVSGVCGVCA